MYINFSEITGTLLKSSTPHPSTRVEPRKLMMNRKIRTKTADADKNPRLKTPSPGQEERQEGQNGKETVC